MERQSLSQFCKINGLSKTSVHRYCKDQGIETSNGLSMDDRTKLLKQFKTTSKAIVHSQPSNVDVVPPEAKNPLDNFDPNLDYTPTDWKYTDTSDLVDMGKRALDKLSADTRRNQNEAYAALFANAKHEGRQIGTMWGQAVMGYALQTKDEMVTAEVKKHLSGNSQQ